MRRMENVYAYPNVIDEHFVKAQGSQRTLDNVCYRLRSDDCIPTYKEPIEER